MADDLLQSNAIRTSRPIIICSNLCLNWNKNKRKYSRAIDGLMMFWAWAKTELFTDEWWMSATELVDLIAEGEWAIRSRSHW